MRHPRGGEHLIAGARSQHLAVAHGERLGQRACRVERPHAAGEVHRGGGRGRCRLGSTQGTAGHTHQEEHCREEIPDMLHQGTCQGSAPGAGTRSHTLAHLGGAGYGADVPVTDGWGGAGAATPCAARCSAVLEQLDEHQPGHEATDVGPDRDTARGLGAERCKLGEPHDELEADPVDEHQPGRHRDDPDDEDDDDEQVPRTRG